MVVYAAAFLPLFVLGIIAYGAAFADMPKVVQLPSGATDYFFCSWGGAVYWPAATLLFGLYCGWGLYLCYSDPRYGKLGRFLRGPRVIVTWITVVAIVALCLSELSGVSPFRAFYRVTAYENTVTMYSGLWFRSVARSEITGAVYHVRQHDGTKQFRYPTLTIEAASGNKWKSFEIQCVEGDAQFARYEDFMRDLRTHLTSEPAVKPERESSR